MSNYLKKTLALTLGASLACTALAGCGPKEKTEGGENGKVTISVGNCPNKDSNEKAYNQYLETVKRFNEKYPDIEIVGDEYQYSVDSFLPKAEGGTLPTLYLTHFTEADKIIGGGYASDISKQYKDFGYYDKTNEYILEMVSKDDGIYFVPNHVYTLGIVANLDMFKAAGLLGEDGSFKAPETFDELGEMAKTIAEKTGKAGFLLPTTGNGGGWVFTALAWNYGANFMEQEDGKWVSKFASAEATEALQFIKDLKWKYNAFPSTTLISNEDAMKLVGTGECAMAFANTDQIDMLRKYDLDLNSIGMMKIPAGPKGHATLMGGTFWAFSNKATPEQIDASMKWLQFTGITPDITEDVKVALEDKYSLKNEEGYLVGIKDLQLWNEKSEYKQYLDEVIDKYCNIDVNHVASYNDKSDIEYRLEEPTCAQDLYALLDSAIQEVLTNESADCATVLKDASDNFQADFLDYE